MTTWSGHHMVDPTEIESRFAIEDGMAFMSSIFEEPSEEAILKVREVLEIMKALPDREADFVELYYFRRYRQTDIADIFRVSQPTVCYRLQRATARIQFLLQLPVVAEADLRDHMTQFLVDPLDVEVMLLMWKTTCQSEAASQLSITQGKVRHRFMRTIKRMHNWTRVPEWEEELNTLRSTISRRTPERERLQVQASQVRMSIKSACQKLPRPFVAKREFEIYETYTRMYQFIAANLNILREVQRPTWEGSSRRYDDLG